MCTWVHVQELVENKYLEAIIHVHYTYNRLSHTHTHTNCTTFKAQIHMYMYKVSLKTWTNSFCLLEVGHSA